MSPDDIMTSADVRKYLKIGKNTLAKLMSRREIPYARLDRKLLFRRADIDRWLESKLVKPMKSLKPRK